MGTADWRLLRQCGFWSVPLPKHGNSAVRISGGIFSTSTRVAAWPSGFEKYRGCHLKTLSHGAGQLSNPVLFCWAHSTFRNFKSPTSICTRLHVQLGHELCWLEQCTVGRRMGMYLRCPLRAACPTQHAQRMRALVRAVRPLVHKRAK